MTKHLTEKEYLLQEVSLEAKVARESPTERDRLILQARASGLTYEQIARAAGLTRQRVQQICKEAQNDN